MKAPKFTPIVPAHYNTLSITPIEAIESWGLGFCLGNTVKYIARAGKKNPAKVIEDLEKAKWYLERQITFIQNQKSSTERAHTSSGWKARNGSRQKSSRSQKR